MEGTPRVEASRRASPYTTQTKTVVIRVHEYLRKLHTSLTECDVEEETSAATGVPLRSLQRFKKEAKEGILTRPPRKKKQPSPVLDSVGELDKESLRRIISSFYERGEIPTLKNILEKVKEPPVNFKCERTSLHTLLKNMGFRYEAVEGGRHILKERDGIGVARSRCLRESQQNRDSSHPRREVYLDETSITPVCPDMLDHH